MEVFIINKYIKTNKILSLLPVNMNIKYPVPHNIPLYLRTR